MSEYIKLVGTSNPHVDGTSVYVINGERVERGVPVQVSGDTREAIENLGGVFEAADAQEAEEYQESLRNAPKAGEDVRMSGPTFEPLSGPQGSNQSFGAEDAAVVEALHSDVSRTLRSQTSKGARSRQQHTRPPAQPAKSE